MATMHKIVRLQNLIWVFVLLAMPVAYVLSYAPVYRCINGPDPPPFMEVGGGVVVRRFGPSVPPPLPRVPGYGPVERLIDDTFLQGALLWWGHVWNCGESMYWSSRARSAGQTNPTRIQCPSPIRVPRWVTPIEVLR
jgi:hypothetical protein